MRGVRRKTWGRFAQVGRNIGGKPCKKVPICRHVRQIEPVSPIQCLVLKDQVDQLIAGLRRRDSLQQVAEHFV
jgi:hypothetical protein